MVLSIVLSPLTFFNSSYSGPPCTCVHTHPRRFRVGRSCSFFSVEQERTLLAITKRFASPGPVVRCEHPTDYNINILYLYVYIPAHTCIYAYIYNIKYPGIKVTLHLWPFLISGRLRRSSPFPRRPRGAQDDDGERRWRR